ncbi:MAG: metallophosphoesterase family protein [Pseudoclavibacter sp.]
MTSHARTPASLVSPLTGLEPRTVALAGDWHANTDYAVASIERARAGGAEAIVHLGDFGFRFAPAYLEALDTALGGVPLYFIDGNHEHFTWLADQPLDGAGMRPLSTCVTHLPRGVRWTWRGRAWLALGGAHSVDRLSREPGEAWWPEESVTLDDIEVATAPGEADVLVCHDAPAGVPVPHVYDDGTYPAADEAAGEAHRDLVRAVVDGTWPRLIGHGHFHRHYRSTLGAATVLGLAHDHEPVEQNLAFVDTATLALVPPSVEPPVIENPRTRPAESAELVRKTASAT